MDDGATRALRAGSASILRVGLLRLLTNGRAQWRGDVRDLYVALALYHDCATRLGLDPTEVFEEVADDGPVELRAAVRAFGRRKDVTPEAFGFAVEERSDGPRYVWAPPPLTSTRRVRQPSEDVMRSFARSAQFDVELPLAEARSLFTPEGERRWVSEWAPEYPDPERTEGV